MSQHFRCVSCCQRYEGMAWRVMVPPAPKGIPLGSVRILYQTVPGAKVILSRQIQPLFLPKLENFISVQNTRFKHILINAMIIKGRIICSRLKQLTILQVQIIQWMDFYKICVKSQKCFDLKQQLFIKLHLFVFYKIFVKYQNFIRIAVQIKNSQPKLFMQRQQLPPVLLTQRSRYPTSIPEGKVSKLATTEIPIISRRGSLSRNGNPISMHDFTDPSLIDQKLRSLSHRNNENDFRIALEAQKKEKANLKFLSYKFNPGEQVSNDDFKQKVQDQYGQYKKPTQQKITINMFYEHKNVLFQDERAPLTYKKLFLQKQNQQ